MTHSEAAHRGSEVYLHTRQYVAFYRFFPLDLAEVGRVRRAWA